MTEIEAKSLKKGDIIMIHDEKCEIVRVHKSPVLVECKSVNAQRPNWHMVKPGRCRRIEA